MIKLIIFDLDGVLTESKDVHFRALNSALDFYSYATISYEDHISKFDGKPTKEKLKQLGIDESEHNKINKKKQSVTANILENHIRKDEKFISIFKRLKENYIIIHWKYRLRVSFLTQVQLEKNLKQL